MRGSDLHPPATQDGIARGVALAALALGLGLALNVNRPIRRAVTRQLDRVINGRIESAEFKRMQEEVRAQLARERGRDRDIPPDARTAAFIRGDQPNEGQ